MFQRYASAFQALLKDQTLQMTERDLHDAWLLKLQLTTSLLIFAPVFQQHRSADDIAKGYQIVIALGKSLIPKPNADISTLPRRSSFKYTSDSGIVGPLYLTAMWCPDPSIRRQAIALLYESSRKEGIWGGVLMAKMVKQAMAAEKRGVPIAGNAKGGVLELARIHGLSAS